MPRSLILDEWVAYDLGGSGGNDKLLETFSFLTKVIQSPDRLVILEGSPFQTKIHSLAEPSTQDTPIQSIVRDAVVKGIITNSSKLILIRPEEIPPLPNKIIKLIKPDDRYLVQLCFKLPGSIFVTSDRPLFQVLNSNRVNVRYRDDFIGDYTG